MSTQHIHRHANLDVQPGVVKISDRKGIQRSGESVVIDVSVDSKYPCVAGVGGGLEADAVPWVMLGADERTLKLDPAHGPESLTTVNFPDHAGWRVVGVEAGSYTVVVTLHRELPDEEESTDPQALPSAHPWVVGSKEFSDDAVRQADFLAGAKHAGLGFEVINSRHATLAWQEEATRLLVGMFKQKDEIMRSMWAQDLKRHMDIPAWMIAKGNTASAKASP